MARRASHEITNVDPNLKAACLSEYTSMMVDQQRGAQRIGTMFGRYEKQGVDKRVIKDLYKLTMQDKTEATKRLRDLVHDAEMMELIQPAGTEPDGQVAMFATETSAPPLNLKNLAATRAYADGYNSGLAGGTIEGSERFGPGSEEFVRWRDGWELGHTDRLERHPEKADETTPPPRRRGRKPSVADDAAGSA